MTNQFPQVEAGATRGRMFVEASNTRPDLPPEAFPAEGWYTQRACMLLQDNASQMSYTGTNTWILREPGDDTCVIVDPGNDMSPHLQRIIKACYDMGTTPVAILLTHTHDDHCEAAEPLADMLGVPVLSMDNGLLPVIADNDAAAASPSELGERIADVHIDGSELKLQTIWVPGHSLDSVGIIIVDDKALISGDVIFGHSSTVLANGTLRQYMSSLDNLEMLINEGKVETFLTGHGHIMSDPLSQIKKQRQHRIDRLEGLRKVIAETSTADPITLLHTVYTDIALRLERPALRNIHAQLSYMQEINDPCLTAVTTIPVDPLEELLQKLSEEQASRQ